MTEFGDAFTQDCVRIERLLPGPIERLWSYLTDPEKRRSWIGGGPIEQRPGGNVAISISNGDLSEKGDLPPPKYAGQAGGSVQILGHVTACEPPHLLVFYWEHDSGLRSEVRFELETAGDKVRLTLTHARLPSRGALVSVSAGWHTYLDILAARLAGGEAPSFWRSHAALEALYDTRIPK